MSTSTYHNVDVCTDCYFAHHYGADTVTDAGGDIYGWTTDGGEHVTRDEPLALLGDAEVTDNTCSNHGYYMGATDGAPCAECGHPSDDSDGMTEFSWSRCQGCGSTLGGPRYRLAVHAR